MVGLTLTIHNGSAMASGQLAQACKLWEAWRALLITQCLVPFSSESFSFTSIIWKPLLHRRVIAKVDIFSPLQCSGEVATCHLNFVPHSRDLYSSVSQSQASRPPLCIFSISLLVNTPDSDNQLVRRELRAWTMFRLIWSLHGVHCFLIPEQGNPLKFSSLRNIHSWICAALLPAMSSHTDEWTSYASVTKHNLNSDLAHFNALWMQHLHSFRIGIIAEYPLRRALTVE